MFENLDYVVGEKLKIWAEIRFSNSDSRVLVAVDEVDCQVTVMTLYRLPHQTCYAFDRVR